MTNSDRGPTANRRTILAKGALLGADALGAAVGAAAPASAETARYARGLATLRRISGERGTDGHLRLAAHAPWADLLLTAHQRLAAPPTPT